MIGQSGLQMMNSLAGSNEKTPDDVQAKTTAVEAGAFEKILTPSVQALTDASSLETPVEGQKSLPHTEPRLPQSDAKSAIGTIARSQPGSDHPVKVQFEPLAESETPSGPDRIQSPAAPNLVDTSTIADKPTTYRQKEVSGQVLPIESVDTASKETSQEVEEPEVRPDLLFSGRKVQGAVEPDGVSSQLTENDSETALPEFQAENVDSSNSYNKGPFEIANSSLAQSEVSLPTPEIVVNQPNDQKNKQPIEDERLAILPDVPELLNNSSEAKVSKAAIRMDEAEDRLPKQVSPISNIPEQYRGAETVVAAQVDKVGNGIYAVPISDLPETSVPSSVKQSTAQNMQLQVQVEKSRSKAPPLLGEPRSETASSGDSSSLVRSPAPPTSSSYFSEGSELKATAPNPTPQTQTMTLETSFFAQSASGEPSEVSIGPSTSVTIIASPRLDAPTVASAPNQADPKLVIQQINQAIIRMDGARTEVTLDPVELGRVSLTFVTKDEGVTVLIIADRSETADLLRRNSEQLQRDLSNAGYEDIELDFSQDDEGADPNSSSAKKLDASGVVQSSSISYSANFNTSGLDIRI